MDIIAWAVFLHFVQKISLFFTGYCTFLCFFVLLFSVSCVFVSMMYKKSCVTLDVDSYAVQG